MTQDFHRFMAEATRLTRAGDLSAATALIQQALSDKRFSSGFVPPSQDDGDVIDVEAREVFDAPAGLLPEGIVLPSGVRPAVDPSPASGDERFVTGHFGHGRAGRDFKLFIPPQAAQGARLPLVVMLHGCTQHADDFAAGTGMNELARTEGFYVLYPEQSARANPQRCWNWFKSQHQQRDRGEPATLAAITRHVMASHGIDPARVYVAGLSAGGAMAAVLGQAYPDLFAAVGVHSGLAPGAATDLPGALAAMKGHETAAPVPCRVPTIVFHGDADATVHARNGTAVFDAARPGDATVRSERRTQRKGRAATCHQCVTDDGRVMAEHWVVHGGAHAWSGGHSAGSYTDPAGPDASAEMLRFFLSHRLPSRLR